MEYQSSSYSKKSFKDRGLFRWLPFVLLLIFPSAKIQAEQPIGASAKIEPPVCEAKIKEHIQYLASEKLQGRRGLHSVKAAEYVAREFQKLKLKPAFKNLQSCDKQSFFQNIPGALDKNGNETIAGKNVAGLLVGSDEKLRHEYLIVAAHHDHLGKRGGKIFFGADDNASGVAMVLELARVLSQSKTCLKRSILFVSFDLEEHLLFGSRWFTAHPPVEIKQIKLMIVADMLGRSLGDMPIDSFFLFGCEHGSGVRETVAKISFDKNVKPVLLSDDFVGTRSDYGPFRDRKIPFIFVSTGQSKAYHTTHDTADKIDYAQVQAISQGLAILATQICDQKQAPVWITEPAVSLKEVQAILDIVIAIENQAKVWDLSPMQKLFVSQTRIQAERILNKKLITEKEKSWLTRTTQLLLFTVF